MDRIGGNLKANWSGIRADWITKQGRGKHLSHIYIIQTPPRPCWSRPLSSPLSCCMLPSSQARAKSLFESAAADQPALAGPSNIHRCALLPGVLSCHRMETKKHLFWGFRMSLDEPGCTYAILWEHFRFWKNHGTDQWSFNQAFLFHCINRLRLKGFRVDGEDKGDRGGESTRVWGLGNSLGKLFTQMRKVTFRGLFRCKTLRWCWEPFQCPFLH